MKDIENLSHIVEIDTFPEDYMLQFKQIIIMNKFYYNYILFLNFNCRMGIYLPIVAILGYPIIKTLATVIFFLTHINIIFFLIFSYYCKKYIIINFCFF